jgi:hypothetical protein
MSADGFSRGTDHPLVGVVEGAPRVWRVGDVVEGADYDALPIGTTVWQWGGAPGEDGHVASCFWTKATADTWHGWDGFRLGRSSKRVIRSLPAAPAPFDAAAAPVGTAVDYSEGGCVTKHAPNDWRDPLKPGVVFTDERVTWACALVGTTIAYPPAPAERQPCAAWEDRGDGRWSLGKVAVVEDVMTTEGDAFQVRLRGKFHSTHRGVGRSEHLRAAQLAAEDALLDDAREVLRLLGKGGA